MIEKRTDAGGETKEEKNGGDGSRKDGAIKITRPYTGKAVSGQVYLLCLSV
jgi:hypothetical protein